MAPGLFYRPDDFLQILFHLRNGVLFLFALYRKNGFRQHLQSIQTGFFHYFFYQLQKAGYLLLLKAVFHQGIFHPVQADFFQLVQFDENRVKILLLKSAITSHRL